jgi:hypothetical protein
MLLNEQYCDVSFEINGHTVKAHRNILTARCEYFRAMLCENLSQDRCAKPIHMDNISLNAFRGLLCYIYTDNLPDDAQPETACELARVSDWYNIKDLKEKAHVFIQSKLSIDNVLKLYICSVDLEPRLESVQQLCLKFIAKNFNQILEKPEFKRLSQAHLIQITQYYAKYQK